MNYRLFMVSVLLSIITVHHCFTRTSLGVAFDTSMGKGTTAYRRKFSSKKKYNHAYIKVLKSLYEENSLEKIPPHKQPRTPLILHQIWVGGKKLPEKYETLRKSWIKKHPHWKHYLWTDEEVQSLKLRNQKYYDKATDPVEKANILRYELLYRYGGVYADIDFQCLQNFDKFNYRYSFYTGICPADCKAMLNNALIGCMPRHPIIKACIENMKNTMHAKTRFQRNGVIHYSHCFLEKLGRSPAPIVALPATYFYPLGRTFTKNDPLKPLVQPETHAIHYWAHTHKNKFSLIDT